MRRSLTFVAVLAASSAVAAPSLAIETGGQPTLPPPPPPPLTNATPGASSPPPPKPRPAASASASVTTSGSATNPPPPADTGASSSGPSPDHALDTRWFIAPMIGFMDDNYSLGIGVRGGKTFDNHLYIGGSFIDQIGNYGLNSFYLGPEGGYDFDLKVVVLRPYLGLGLFSWTGGTDFVVWPGCSVLWDIPGSNFFLGGDLRFIVNAPLTPFAAYFMAGIHFGT